MASWKRFYFILLVLFILFTLAIYLLDLYALYRSGVSITAIHPGCYRNFIEYIFIRTLLTAAFITFIVIMYIRASRIIFSLATISLFILIHTIEIACYV